MGRKLGFLGLIILALSLLVACAPAAVPTPTPTKAPAAAPTKPPEAAPTKAPEATKPPAPAATPTAAAKPTPITLKVSSSRAETVVQMAGIKWWGDEVEKRSGGRVKFQYYWAGALTKSGEDLEHVRTGVTDLGSVWLVDYPAKLVMGNIFYNVPFGPSDMAMVLDITKKLYAEIPQMNQEMDQQNQKVVAFLIVPTYDLGSKDPIRTVADFKGKKVGVIGSAHPKWLGAVGAAAVAMPFPERYMALKTGVVDSQLMSVDGIFSMKAHEVNKNITYLGLGAALSAVLTINRDSWNKLPPEIQDIMAKTGDDAARWVVDRTKGVQADAKAAMEKEGVTFHTFPQEEKEKWVSALPELVAEWTRDMEAKGLPGKQSMGRLLSLAKELGYKLSREWKLE